MFLNRAVTAVALIGGILATILSLLYGNPLLPIISDAFFCLSLLLWKYGYLVIPFFTKAEKIVEVHDGYEVPP